MKRIRFTILKEREILDEKALDKLYSELGLEFVSVIPYIGIYLYHFKKEDYYE